VRAHGLPFSVSGIAPRTIDALQDVAELRRASLPPAPPRPLPEPPPVREVEEPIEGRAEPVAPPPAPERPAPEPAAPPAVAFVPPPPEPIAVEPPPVVEPEPVLEPEPEPAPAVEPEPVDEVAPAAEPPPAPEPVAAVEPEPEPAPLTRRVRVTFTRDALERALAFLEQSDYGGLVTHLFAIRTLMPTAFVGLNGDVPGKLAAEREALRGVVDRLFIKMRMPRYALTTKDIEDRTARQALIDLVGALHDATAADDPGADDAAIVLEGPVDEHRLTTHLAQLESDPLGTARPWLVLAEMLPWTFLRPAAGSALNAYRSLLIATFTNIAALPAEEFHRVLAGTQNSALDAALRDVRAALRGALEATAVPT
jgi:hypothetical protein